MVNSMWVQAVVERGALIVVKNTAGSILIRRLAFGYLVPKITMTPFAVRGRSDSWKQNSVEAGTALTVLGDGVSGDGSSWPFWTSWICVTFYGSHQM